MNRLHVSGLCVSLLLLSGCPTGSTSNSQSSQFNDGLNAEIQANIHEGETSAKVVAAAFQDGVRVNLIAADVFEATTATKGVLLKSVNVHTGDYIGTLPIDDKNQPVTITIQHKPIEAREDRWYPIDILNVDPGPGELVGRFATVSFPSELDLLGPSNNTIYIDRDDNINITWTASGRDDDAMRLSAAVSCSNSSADLSYGLSYSISEDDNDGLYTIAMNKLVYNDSITAIALEFVEHITRIFLAATIEVLTFGLIDESDLTGSPINIETANCDINLTLIRERDGDLDDEFDGGKAIGSTSASTTILYRPNGI